MALASRPMRRGLTRTLCRMRQYLSWAMTRSPGPRSRAWARLASVNDDRRSGRHHRPEVVATELRQRIQTIATQSGVTEATVLRTYMPDDWGQDMARQTYRQIQERDAHQHARRWPISE